MSIDWLARVPASASWSHQAWSDFAAMSSADRERLLVILPVHGFADHGLGLPLDAEEVVGSVVLARALAAEVPPCRVLPPVRLALAPYPSCFFGIDPETAHAQLREMLTGVADAGFRRVVFFNTSPWNEELVDAASRDLRASTGLHTFFIHLGALGCDFHPGSPGRAQAQAAALHVLGRPAPAPARPGDVRHAGFRPGNYVQPAPLEADSSPDGDGVLARAGDHLARLLREIDARGGTPSMIASVTATTEDSAPWPPTYRNDHYLPALTRDALEAIPDKARALVIVPTGAIEQHGHHLPVGVDAILGQAWLGLALPRLPAGAAVYVAPPIMVGKSNEHVGFPGTLAISATTLRRLLLALATQLHDLGFRRIAVLNTHGGNSAVLVYTLREIQTRLGLTAGMLSGYYRASLSAQEAAFGFHAGEWETSLMLAVAPELVRMDRAVCEYPARIDDPGELRPEDAPAVFSWLTRDVSRSGVMGDAPAGTAEKGHRWLDEASTALTAQIASLLGPGC